MIRIGQGYDVHQLVEGLPLIIGGVKILHPAGLKGHSDADVLSHVVGDALLGAAGLGDLGTHFSDQDARFAGISSLILLKEIAKMLRKNNWQVVNVDCTLVAQAPKLAPHVDAIKENLAAAIGLKKSQINVKATTTETLGFAGRKEGMAAYAVALIEDSK